MTDIVASTELWESDPVNMRHALAQHDALTAEAVVAAGGELVKATGDGAFGIFEDVGSAVRAAIRIVHDLELDDFGLARPIRVRCGIHHGTAFARDHDYFGPAVNRAARICDAAHAGQILISDAALASGALPSGVDAVTLGSHKLRSLPEPIVLHQATGPGLTRQFPPLRGSRPARPRLPRRLDTFVGRGLLVEQIEAVLVSHALVTLVGPGGVGKTRLAHEILHRHTSTADVIVVDLRPSRSGTVAQTFVSALGGTRNEADPSEAVGALLGSDAKLIVVDNAEHVLDDVRSIVQDVMQTRPAVTFLVTSRRPLACAGEQVVRVSLMECGTVDDEGPTLFLDRAGVEVGPAEAVVELCRRLDGLPLAIELAARHARNLTVQDILAGLGARFELLDAGGSGASLSQTIEWSMDLLDPSDQELFDALAVFGNGAAVDEIAEVTGRARTATVLSVARLIDLSLVTRESPSPNDESTRVGMLESIRDHARSRLVDRSSVFDLSTRHRSVYLALLESLGPGLRSPEEARSRVRYRAEFDNIACAVEGALDDENVSDVARLLFEVLPFENEERTGRGATWFARAAGLPGIDDHPDGPGLLAAVALVVRHSSHQMAANLLDRARAADHDPIVQARIVEGRAGLAAWSGRPAQSAAMHRDAHDWYLEAGEPGEAARNLALGAAVISRADTERALAIADEAALIAEELGQPTALGYVAFARSLALSTSDLDAAIRQLEASIARSIEAGNPSGRSRVLIDLAELRARRGGSLLEAMSEKIAGLQALQPEAGVFIVWDALRTCLPWMRDAGLCEEVVAVATALDRVGLRGTRRAAKAVDECRSRLEAPAIERAVAQGTTLDLRGARDLVIRAGSAWIDQRSDAEQVKPESQVAGRDWLAWHEPYDDPDSPLSRRLATVQHHLRQAIEARSSAATTVLSLCAGQGHDVIGVLAELPERSEVTATLVEFDPRNVAVARQAVAAASLDQVEIREADAGTTDSMVGAVPADILLVCGVFGNIADADIERTIGALPSLCAAGATVIWTRHRRPPDLTPTVRGWFADAGFEEAGFDFPDDVVYGVGTHRLTRPPARFEPGRRLFTFVGYDTLLADQT